MFKGGWAHENDQSDKAHENPHQSGGAQTFSQKQGGEQGRKNGISQVENNSSSCPHLDNGEVENSNANGAEESSRYDEWVLPQRSPTQTAFPIEDEHHEDAGNAAK